jgi:hypothetical protein
MAATLFLTPVMIRPTKSGILPVSLLDGEATVTGARTDKEGKILPSCLALRSLLYLDIVCRSINGA